MSKAHEINAGLEPGQVYAIEVPALVPTTDGPVVISGSVLATFVRCKDGLPWFRWLDGDQVKAVAQGFIRRATGDEVRQHHERVALKRSGLSIVRGGMHH